MSLEYDDKGQMDELIASYLDKTDKPALTALIIGDMTYEECEISWIVQRSYKPLPDAFPLLEQLRIRGGNALVIEPFAHRHLRKLTIESGSVDEKVALALAQSSMPQLEPRLLRY